MVIYKTFIKGITDDGRRLETVSWQGSQTEASKARSAAKKEGNKAESMTVNVPTSKGGLLDWLNEHVKA